MNGLALCLSLLACAPLGEPPVHRAALHGPTEDRPAKVVSVEVIALDEPESATVRIGDTLEITVPVWPGTEWKVIGEQPTNAVIVPRYLSPTIDGIKFRWKIAGPKGVRKIRLVGSTENNPKQPPVVVTVTVTVEE